jgi:PAS domain S-box-containing protein
MLAWWGGVRFIRRPLRELTAVALRWRDGDQSARVTLPGRSEIAVLGRAFNTMADAKDQSDRQTREGVELLSSLIDSSRDSIFVFDSSGRLLVANSTFLELIGLAHEEAIGRELMLALDPDLQRAFDDLRFQVITTRLPQASDIRARGPEQKQHVLQAICTPIFGEHATVRAVAGIGRDVTDVRETAECLQKARDQAEAADHAKTRFLAAASHDLRQPLQAAVMLADLLVERTGDSDPSIPEVRLCRSLGDLKRLVECLFDISRLDSGAIQPEFTNFPLQDLLDEVTISYAALAKEKGIALTVSRTSAVVRSDRILLGRVLSNLIDNAVKYTPAGNVKVECYPRNGVLQISIEDTGIGVSQQDQSRIWLEFEQLHNEQRDRRRGLGLGLAIVRRLSALLEHPMELESEPGQGSCFTITVPCIQTRPDMASDRCTTLHPGRCVAPGRAVIIDDDPMVLDVLRMTLEEHGWDVIAALDVAEVTNQLLSTEWIPDLVMVDYRLRDGQVGTDAIASVRKVLRKQLPAIILTGELPGAADQPDRPLLDARRIGAALVRKPVQSNELMELMNSVIAASRMSSPLDEAAT